MGTIAEFIDNLPDEFRPLTASLVDGVYGGLIDNAEALADAIIEGKFSDAYENMLKSLDAESLITVLEKINKESAVLIANNQRNADTQKEIVRRLIVMSFTFLRTAIIADSGATGT